MKKILLSIYTWSMLNPQTTNKNQKRIRDTEWEAVESFIRKGNFLDVGCGAGYAMQMARERLNCRVQGIDPDPGGHGVGRTGSAYTIDVVNIKKGFSEDLPYSDAEFDTVYSSHVLEHVTDELKTLQEMHRVLKDDGILIIGMPTASMAFINMLSSYVFTTHFKLVNLLMKPFINTGRTRWWELFIPVSHSFTNRTILYDLRHYRIANWRRTVEREFVVKKVLKPALYPYPEYRQWFPLMKNKALSSSVFFVCEKRTQTK